MPDKAVYLLVVDGFADWEPAHAIAELRRHGGYRVESVGLTRDSVVSMGGLRVTPSRTVDQIEPNDIAVFILPGGDRWETMPMEVELASALKRLDSQSVPLAAICAATSGDHTTWSAARPPPYQQRSEVSSIAGTRIL